MSKNENHWYLLGILIRGVRQGWRVRLRHLALWLALVCLALLALHSGGLDLVRKYADSRAFVPVFTLGFVGLVLGGVLVVARWRRDRARSAYMTALQHVGPEKLVQAVEQTWASAHAFPDLDAFSAQARALAYALYGRGDEAAFALRAVDWGGKAPLVQGAGLSAEGIAELLCRRDVPRGLELNRKARALATLGDRVPGAAHTQRYHAVCVAVGEVLVGAASPEGLRQLEESAADPTFPPLQLLASFGHAVALEQVGDTRRAAHVRALLRRVAPNCAPLHATASDFSTSVEPRPPLPRSVFAALDSAIGSGGTEVQERFAKSEALRAGGKLGLGWLVLVLALLAVWTLLAPGR